MKKKLILLIILCVFAFPSVYAHEMLEDGWHIVPASDANSSDSWENQQKVWALYVNGTETKRYSTLIGAHRGWGDAPENSLSSFRLVLANGYSGIETDVRFTKDNVPVLCHDSYINDVAVNNDLTALGSDKIYIKDLTYEQLSTNYIFNIERLNHDGNTTLSNYYTNRITTFSEMLDFVKAANFFVSIELKEGTREQIASLVQMVNSKNMHYNVKWISFQINLLEYVKEVDDDELLGVLLSTAGTCSADTPNKYCEGGENHLEVYNRLKTTNNYVWLAPYSTQQKLPSSNFGVNLPSTNATMSQRLTEYTLTTIPQGTLTVTNNIKYLPIGGKRNLTYTYTGDGTVKCLSSNTNFVTCSVDNTNKKITINSVGTTESSASVAVYATQGIAYSATPDSIVNLSIVDEEKLAQSYVKGLVIEGYDLGFENTNHNYKIKIKDENKLDIKFTMEGEDFTYNIEGNNDLKNGSIILINVLNSESKKVLSYRLEIEKEEFVEIPDTSKYASKILYFISILLILTGIVFIVKNTKKDEE